MAERFDLGGAAFHLVVDSRLFGPVLKQAEADAKAASGRIDAALRSGAITPKVNAAPANQAFGEIVTHAKAAQTAASFTATPKINAQQAQSAIGGLGTGLKGLVALGAGAAGVTLGIAAIGEAITGSIAATREAQQATLALNTTYGSGATQFAAFADAQAQALGKSNVEFKQAAVAASTLSKNYGLTAEQIQTVIKRSTDLATVQGIGIVDATNRVTSAIRGEAEAAELLGLTLNSDAIKAIADMTDEQRKNFETLDTITKAQITYREFLRQTAFAEGAAAKAAADGATAYDQAGAALKNLGTEAGNAADPIGKGLAGAFRDAANASATYIAQIRADIASIRQPGTLPPLQGPAAPSEDQLAKQAEENRQQRGREAAAAAQLARTEASRLAAIARESQADLTRSALDGLSKRREASAEAARAERERITDTRDADIAASSARRDAALAALDREAQGRARARTLEDRERSDSQEATLRGLEQIHNATLQGLDAEANGVQKRRDDAVRGIEAEIRAVDQKRDGALRAIDEETRAESRRHAEALRNIDVERDRKLGIIDEELKKLDAAALADQRRQTDQSLARNLNDAKRDLRSAETPEERARAQRAVNDAIAAQRREAVNRQREDARARLRDAADQIRLAADTAKKIEDARNQAATEGLAGRKQQAQDQAAADTERLQAVKTRVDEETKIQLDGIKGRVDAEKIAYDQTVQDARDSFEQISRAVADRRADEDAELAARRINTQAHYKAEQDDIKAVADTQLTALEKSTNDTAKELDLQKAAWSDWARHVEKEIAAAITAGDPDRIKSLSLTPPELQNAGAGPGEPPSRDEAAGNLTASAKKLAADVAAGIAAGIGSQESVAAAKAATDDLIQQGVIDPAKTILGIASPSTVFAGFGSDTAQGFLDGYQSLDLAAPIRKPFEDSIVWLGGLPDIFRQDATDTAAAWQTGYAVNDIFAVSRKPFEDLIVWMAGLDDEFLKGGREAGISWAAGWRQANLLRFVGDEMEAVIRKLGEYNSWFLTAGGNAAQSWINGWNGVIAGFKPQVAAPTTPTATRPDLVYSTGLNGTGGSRTIPVRLPTNADGGWIPEPTWLVSARTGQPYGTAGEVAPEYISPSGPMRGGGGGTTTLNMPVSIDARGVQNADQLVQVAMPRIMQNVADFLDIVERNAPDPAPGTLGGS